MYTHDHSFKLNALRRLLFLLTSLLLLAGCSTPRSYVVLLKSPDGTTGKVMVTGKQGSQVIDRAGSGALLDGSGALQDIDEKQLEQDFAAARAAQPLLPLKYQLYFESGGTQLTVASMALLPEIISAISKRTAVDISIIGHTDTMGEAQLNAKLALNRAEFVADQLRQQGLDIVAISIESHGERNLLVKTPDETAEPKNRRVEIAIR